VDISTGIAIKASDSMRGIWSPKYVQASTIAKTDAIIGYRSLFFVKHDARPATSMGSKLKIGMVIIYAKGIPSPQPSFQGEH
jgi:hypothetical protein